MKIKISTLNKGFNHLTEMVEPSSVDLDTNRFNMPIDVRCDIEMLPGKIKANIETLLTGIFQCDRCLDDYSGSFSGTSEITFIKRDTPLPGEMPGDNLRSFVQGQNELDISTEIRDSVLLSLPMQCLCKEDCRGICQRCGANLNTENCKCRN